MPQAPTEEKEEKWEVVIGKDRFIINGSEKNMLLSAGDARFVHFRDFIINPAFVQSITLVERKKARLMAPWEEEGEEVSEERRKMISARINLLRKTAGINKKKL